MAIIRREKSKDALLRRAHLGNVDNPEEILNLARRHGIKTVPLDVVALMDVMGIDLVYCEDFEKDESGSLTKKDDGSWVCKVNAKHHPTRQRFTIAHELAHYILHRNQKNEFVDFTYFRSFDSKNAMEYEADSFAGMLLMPESDISYFINNVSFEIDEIAKHFGVSSLAVRVRARQLGLEEN